MTTESVPEKRNTFREIVCAISYVSLFALIMLGPSEISLSILYLFPLIWLPSFLIYNCRLLKLKLSPSKVLLNYAPDYEDLTDLPLLLLQALYFFFAISFPSSNFYFNVLYFLHFLTYAIFSVERAYVPLLYREDGIWTRDRFIKWQEIQSWHWEKEASPKLVLKLDKRFFKEQELYLRKKHRPIVEELLQKHSPSVRQTEL